MAHKKFNRDITPNELGLIHKALNPVLTTAAKNTIDIYLANLDDVGSISADVAELVYSVLWRKEVGRHISEYGYHLIDGNNTELDDLQGYLDKVGKDFIPDDFAEPVDTDPVKLFNSLNLRGKWQINIPGLREKITHVSPGQFIVFLARPESGKTATLVNLIAGREGFAAQGANVHFIANEERADITAGRSICCYNQISTSAVWANPEIANTDGWRRIRKNLTFLHQPEMTMAQLDFYCKTHRPDVLVVDQLPHVGINGTYSGSHDRLGAIYRKAREISTKYDCTFIGVNQASIEAEGKSIVTFSMAEGSKTAIAAAADLIVGIGKPDDTGQNEANEVLRYFTVSKNKISGWKGKVVAKLIQDQSRLVA